MACGAQMVHRNGAKPHGEGETSAPRRRTRFFMLVAIAGVVILARALLS